MWLKTHKYHARPQMVDGIRFASQKEATRYGELKLLEKAGKIFNLHLQPRFRLVPFWPEWRKDEPQELGYYVADFRYCNVRFCGCAYGCTIEDVKGFKTSLYKWKKKHVELQYGITIREI